LKKDSTTDKHWKETKDYIEEMCQWHCKVVEDKFYFSPEIF